MKRKEGMAPNDRAVMREGVFYAAAGVREYWIVDTAKERTTVYRYEEDEAPVVVPFGQDLTVGIYGDLTVLLAEFME